MAHGLDSKTGVQAARLWTDEEIDLLLSGQPVPYRTTHGCAGKLRRLGIRKGPGHYLVRAPYQLPKPVPGKIPWPAWWRRAHLMRMEGYRATDIAGLLGQNRQSVRSALYPSTHESQTQRARRRRQDPAYQAKERARASRRDSVRDKARKLARLRWRAAGGAPRALERFYRALDCL